MDQETGELAAVAQQLGSKYLLGEEIGRGAMGRVFAGTARDSGEPVAIKVLRPELVSDPEAVARFMQERQILTSVSSPHTVRIIDLVMEGQTLAIIMELVSGQDLRHYLRPGGAAQRTLPPAEAVGLTAQLLTGLAAVHASGVVHRDIKPENLLLDTAADNVTVKVSDFGVARLSYGASLTKLTSQIGTPEYMAPELAEGESASPAVDIYSAGIVLYEMLSGRTPFAGGLPVAVLRRHTDMVPPPVPGIPAALWDQVSRMLAKDPADRPEAAGEAAAELGALAPELAPLAAQPAMAAPASYQRVTEVAGLAAPAAPDGDTMTVIRHRDRGVAAAPNAAAAAGGSGGRAGQDAAAGAGPAKRPAAWWRRAILPTAAVAVVAAVAAFALPSWLRHDSPTPHNPTRTITGSALAAASAQALSTTAQTRGSASAVTHTRKSAAPATGQTPVGTSAVVAPVIPNVPQTQAAPGSAAAEPVHTTAPTHTAAPVRPAPMTSSKPAATGAAYTTVSLGTGDSRYSARAYFGQLSAVTGALAGQVTLNMVTTKPTVCVETVVFSGLTGASGTVSALGAGAGWAGAETAPSPTIENGNQHQQVIIPPAGGGAFTLSAVLAEGASTLSSGTYSLSLTSQAGSVQAWLVGGQAVSCDTLS